MTVSKCKQIHIMSYCLPVGFTELGSNVSEHFLDSFASLAGSLVDARDQIVALFAISKKNFNVSEF